MEQGSAEWLEWRRQGIGASETPVLLLADDRKTPYQLYLEKTGQAKADDGGSAQIFQLGHEAEAELRAAYEFETGLEFAPALFEHPEFPFIRASLDGWNPDAAACAAAGVTQGMECKLVGAEAFTAPIPHKHMIQMQHQMLVTATDTWTYLRKDKTTGQRKRDVMKADPKIQMDILGACWQFQHYINTKTQPPFTERDWIPDQRPELVRALAGMRDARTTKERNGYRADVLTLVVHKRTICHGVKISRDPDRVTFPKEADHAG